MSDQQSFINVDNLLLQLALQTRELSQQKDGINHQIEICRADITEKKSYTETTRRNIKKLEEEITMKQNIVRCNRANAKSMKVTNRLLLEYEMMLKAELERREESYNQDTNVYGESIASYMNVFQEHKEHYCQNPLAKKLLVIQAEKEEIEHRIKACEDKITMKQKELANLRGQTVHSSADTPADSISVQLTATEPEKPVAGQIVEDISSSIDISSIHLTQTEDGHKTSWEANAEEVHDNSVTRDTPCYPPAPEEASPELWSYQELYEQSQQSDQMATEYQDQGRGPEEQEDHPTTSGVEETVAEEMEEGEAVEEEQAPFSTNKDDNEGVFAFPQSSPPRSNPQASPGRNDHSVSSTPTFSVNSSPSDSTGKGTPNTKSPAFLFSVTSDPNTPTFSGFGFDTGQEEDSPFTFPSSYFSDKKTSESKPPSATGFLFDQTEQREEDFQFSFGSKSPLTATADPDKTAGDDFPFSFNFGKF